MIWTKGCPVCADLGFCNAHPKPATIEEVEEELATVRSEIEPLQRAEAALLARREQLWRNEHA